MNADRFSLKPNRKTLTISDHDRDIAGLKYVYPVMSRRAGGLSIGINFNPNNACNWRCIYCQVPNLKRGSAPAMDFPRLEAELRFFLHQVLHGDFFDRFEVVAEQRSIKDIAISGNGEPTSLKHFEHAIDLIGGTALDFGIFPDSRFVLISNGSLMHQTRVQAGLKKFAEFGGELWFKLDSATPQGRQLINNCAQSDLRLFQNLAAAAQICPTKLQTCMFGYRNAVWSEKERKAYLQLLQTLREKRIPLQKILLYTIARASHQPEAAELTNAEPENMRTFAAEIEALGYEVGVSV